MNSLFNIQELKSFIAQNRTQTVINSLLKDINLIENQEQKNSFLMLVSRWQKIKTDKISGMLTKEAYDLEHNKINSSLLIILDELNVPIEHETNTLVNLRTKKVVISSVLVLIACLIYLYKKKDIAPTVENKKISTEIFNPETILDTMINPKKKTIEAIPIIKAPLNLEIKSNKGSDKLVFSEGEEVRLFFKVNKVCNLRSIYRLADDSLVLLDDDRIINQIETNRWIEIGDGYEVFPPFGVEELYIFVQKESFSKLVIETIDGYQYIKEGLPQSLQKTRGLKKKKIFVEKKLHITTKPL